METITARRNRPAGGGPAHDRPEEGGLGTPAQGIVAVSWWEGRRAHPGVFLGFRVFARAYPRFRREADGAPLAPPADLFLAVACDAGVPGSWRALETYRPLLRGLLRRRGATVREVAEVLDDLPGFLCESPADGRARSRMGTFLGRSRLSTWLAAVALHRLWRFRRLRGRTLPVRVASLVASREAPVGNGMHREEEARALRRALHDGWSLLSPRERDAFLLRYRDGIDQRRIARSLGVGESRVSRLLRGGVMKLQEAVRRGFPAGLPAPGPDDGCLREVLAEAMRWGGEGRAPSP